MFIFSWGFSILNVPATVSSNQNNETQASTILHMSLSVIDRDCLLADPHGCNPGKELKLYTEP